MTEKEQITLRRFEKYVYENDISNDFLVQLIERAGSYLNLQTISDYAKAHGKSYNGIKKCRETREIFNVKFVIDNN